VEPDNQYYNEVIDTSYWLASGTALKNGQIDGQVLFDGSVVAGTQGPHLILLLNSSNTVILNNLLYN
jgi:hypothetical protein